MSSAAFRYPAPPDWSVDWEALTDEFAWIRAMRDCPQDPVFHPEGSVWTHVGMVCRALAGLNEFRALREAERQILFAAALLHDVAKPLCTRQENGRISSRGHSQRGAVIARRILWEAGFDFRQREQVCALVRYHQQPYHLLNAEDAQRTVFRISQTVRCDWLAMLSRADVLGRTSADRAELLAHIDLFRDYCSEQDCLDHPYAFPSSHSRCLYFRMPGRDPHYRAHEHFRCEATVMSGLPGAGKDTWIASYAGELPVISLDAIRQETGADATGNQGAVVQAAREKARTFLRAGQNFVWNGTNLSRDLRSQVVDLLLQYDARVRIVYVEAGAGDLFDRNRGRARVVPPAAIDRMMDRWEVPDPFEAQAVEWWIDNQPRERG
jgi:predicted kinase